MRKLLCALVLVLLMTGMVMAQSSIPPVIPLPPTPVTADTTLAPGLKAAITELISEANKPLAAEVKAQGERIGRLEEAAKGQDEKLNKILAAVTTNKAAPAAVVVPLPPSPAAPGPSPSDLVAAPPLPPSSAVQKRFDAGSSYVPPQPGCQIVNGRQVYPSSGASACGPSGCQ